MEEHDRQETHRLCRSFLRGLGILAGQDRQAAHDVAGDDFPEAGTFTKYHDSLSAALRGTVAVPMTADMAVISLGSVVTFTLGTVPASNLGPIWHDVQGRVNGGAWTTAATTGANTFGYTPKSAGTWEFQTRLHQALGSGSSGWSPTLTVTVI